MSESETERYRREIGWWLLENNLVKDFRSHSSVGERTPKREGDGSIPSATEEK